MENHGWGATGGPRQVVPNVVHINLHNGTQAAGRITQGQSQAASNETGNSTDLRLITREEEATDDSNNETDTAEAGVGEESGYEDGSVGTASSPVIQSVNAKRKAADSEDDALLSKFMKRLKSEFDIKPKEESGGSAVRRQLDFNKDISASNPLCSSDELQIYRNEKNWTTPGVHSCGSQEPKIRYQQHGSQSGSVSGTSHHLVDRLPDGPYTHTPTPTEQLQTTGYGCGGEPMSRWRKTGSYERTQEYIDSLPNDGTGCSGTTVVSPPARSAAIYNIPPEHQKFLQGFDLSRVPDRLASFNRWQRPRARALTEALANAGFFYFGYMDRMQCSYCDYILEDWDPDDDIEAIHRQMSHQCSMVQATQSSVLAPANTQGATPEENTTKTTQFSQQGSFGVLQARTGNSPAIPHMRIEEARIKTFHGLWPVKDGRSMIMDLAEAGYFFLGEGDLVKCWYCGGVLRNLKEGDDFWSRHAESSPNCGFLLELRGQNFINSICNPHKFLPTQPENILPKYDGKAKTHLPVVEGLLQGEVQTKEGRIEYFMELHKQIVEEALKFGFKEKLIKAVFQDELATPAFKHGSQIFYSTGQLVDALQLKQKERRKKMEELEQELQQLREESACPMASTSSCREVRANHHAAGQ